MHLSSVILFVIKMVWMWLAWRGIWRILLALPFLLIAGCRSPCYNGMSSLIDIRNNGDLSASTQSMVWADWVEFLIRSWLWNVKDRKGFYFGERAQFLCRKTNDPILETKYLTERTKTKILVQSFSSSKNSFKMVENLLIGRVRCFSIANLKKKPKEKI